MSSRLSEQWELGWTWTEGSPQGHQTPRREPGLSPSAGAGGHTMPRAHGPHFPKPSATRAHSDHPQAFASPTLSPGPKNGRRKEWAGKALISGSRIFHPPHTPLEGIKTRTGTTKAQLRSRRWRFPRALVHTVTSCSHRPRTSASPPTPDPAATFHTHACSHTRVHTHTRNARVCSHAHTTLRHSRLRHSHVLTAQRHRQGMCGCMRAEACTLTQSPQAHGCSCEEGSCTWPTTDVLALGSCPLKDSEGSPVLAARLGPAPQVAALAPCPKVPGEVQRQFPLRESFLVWPLTRHPGPLAAPLSPPAPDPGCLFPRAHRDEGRPDARPPWVQARGQRASMGLESLGIEGPARTSWGAPMGEGGEGVGKGAREGLSQWFPGIGDSNGLMAFRQPAQESL